ncbi:MAG: hypothetical protein KAY37_10120, partial [Phycisphaerae bacterium]|nr:hypothetical protein [Phycisphaerae bacterium]
AVSAVSMGGTAVSAVYKSQVFTADTAVPPIGGVPLLLSSAQATAGHKKTLLKSSVYRTPPAPFPRVRG